MKRQLSDKFDTDKQFHSFKVIRNVDGESVAGTIKESSWAIDIPVEATYFLGKDLGVSAGFSYSNPVNIDFLTLRN
jgi:hypothetical protein